MNDVSRFFFFFLPRSLSRCVFLLSFDPGTIILRIDLCLLINHLAERWQDLHFFKNGRFVLCGKKRFLFFFLFSNACFVTYRSHRQRI